MTRMSPQPSVTIGGETVAAGRLSSPTAQTMVVDGLSCTWGKDDPLAQPELATATVTLWDRTRTWAMARELRGVPVTLSWPHPFLAGTPMEFFRGRIDDVEVIPHTAGGVRGSLVVLPCRSIVADLAQHMPIGAWPAETLEQRRARLVPLLRAAGIVVNSTQQVDEVTIRSGWGPAALAPVDADQQRSLYDHLLALYDSCGGDRMTYVPRENRFSFVQRRAHPSARGLGKLERNVGEFAWQTARRDEGAYPTATGGNGATAFLHARDLDTPGDGLRRPASAGITRVEVSHPDGTQADYPDTLGFMAVKGTDESVNGRRTARLESLIANNAWADLACADLEALVREDGAGWRLPTLTYDTRRSGGFEDLDQLFMFLGGYEDPFGASFFLQRSLTTHDYGVRPVFGVIGATMTYADSHWRVEFDTAPVGTLVPQHPITWDELDDGTAGKQVRFYDSPHPNGLHPTLSIDDLRFVSQGVGVTTPPRDQGWDSYL